MRERRERLADSDLLFTDVLLEPVLPYEATDVLAEVVEQIGLDPRVTRLVGEALFGDYTTPGEPYRLRSHQAQALRQSLQPGASPKRNVVVTSGTGSGKTESFLLPVLARLVAESLTWAKGGWTRGGRPRRASGEAAVRRQLDRQPSVPVLYPTNALVEDQITRLRKAVRVIADQPDGHQFWLGRYTGATLGGGDLPNSAKDGKVKEVSAQIRDTVAEFDSLTRHPEIDLNQFPDRAKAS